MPDWQDLLTATGFTLLSLALMLLVRPMEWFFPRIAWVRHKWRRELIIAGTAGTALLLSLLFQLNFQQGLISSFLGVKVISIAKLPLHAAVIFVVSFLLLDLFAYVLHYIQHRIPLLWRFHAVHHADEQITSSTGFLHHPLELVLSSVLLLFFAVVLGIPVIVYVIYGTCMAVQSVMAHTNIAFPAKIDRMVRWVLVTPDVHRTHHSVDWQEGNSNFGQLFNIWDRLFGTYVDSPAATETGLLVGLPDSEKPAAFSVAGLLLHPFRRRRPDATSVPTQQ